jgi:hypothetical protein
LNKPNYSNPNSKISSFINPETVLILCVFIAASAVFGLAIAQNIYEKVPLKSKSLETCGSVNLKDVEEPAKEMARVDSGVDITDTNSLMSKLLSEGHEVLSDEEILALVDSGKIAPYSLEKTLGDFSRAVKIRRFLVCKDIYLIRFSADRKS